MPFDESPSDWKSDSVKWQHYPPEVIPSWIAALDFRSPTSVIAAVQNRVAKGMFDYVKPAKSTFDAIVSAMEKRYAWKIESDWIVFVPALVPAKSFAVKAFSEREDEVLIFSPAYPPFFHIPTSNQRIVNRIPLVLDSAAKKFVIDWDECKKAITPKSKMLLWCHPHNPTGKAFDREELQRLGNFCIENNLILVSDEIWCDLALDGSQHIPTASLSPEVASRTITLMAPSKTYNLSGLSTGFAIIPDPKVRAQFRKGMEGASPMTVLGLAACEAAYREDDAEEWRKGLIDYLRANRDFLVESLPTVLPGVQIEAPIQATFLAWLNISSLGLENPADHFEKNGVGLVCGKHFGAVPGQYIRLNFGCHRNTLAEILKRMSAAIKA